MFPSQAFSPEQLKQKLVEKLAERGVRSQCELCEKNNWSIVEQPISIIIGVKGGFQIPPPQLPSAGIVGQRGIGSGLYIAN